jgi:hypothetical protein
VAQGTIGFATKKRLQVGFTEADLTPWSAAGYPGCQILPEAITRPRSLESERLRDAILKMDLHTAFGAFKVDRTAFRSRTRC